MRSFHSLAAVSLFTIAHAGAARAQVAFVQEGTVRNLVRANEPAAAATFGAPPAGSNLAYGTFLVDLSGDGWLDAVLVNHGQFPHTSGEWINAGNGTGFGQNLFSVAVSGP